MGEIQGFLPVILLLCINLLATVVYLFFLSSDSRKKRFFSMPVWLQKSFVLFFVGPLFTAPFLSQTGFPIEGLYFIRTFVGILLAVGGLIFITLAFFKIGIIPNLKEKSSLSIQGVYGIVRHPIYSGTILAFLGLNLTCNAFLSLLYFPLSVMLYFLMTVYEEKSLIREYGQEYVMYRKKVKKRIIPFVL